MGERRVVERAALLRHPQRVAPEVGDQPGGEVALGGSGGEAEVGAVEAAEVDVGTGEGHCGVHGDDPGPEGGGRGQYVEAVAAGRVDDVLARTERSAGTEDGDDVGEHVVRDREQQHVTGPRDGAGLLRGDAGQERGDPLRGGVGLSGGGHDLVTGGAEAGGEYGADATRADDTHPKVLRHVRTFRSSPSDHPLARAGVGTGRCARLLSLLEQREMYAEVSHLGTDGYVTYPTWGGGFAPGGVSPRTR